MRTSHPRRILFLISRFLDGGIDTVLVEYLQHMAGDSHYRLTLAIGCSMGRLEVYADRVPRNVEVTHLVDAEWLTRWRRQKVEGHLPAGKKLLDEMLLSPIRRWQQHRKLRRLTAAHDVVIDFDCCFYSLLKDCSTRKIAWFHFSFEQSLQQNRRRTMRIGRQLEHYDHVVLISQSMADEARRLFPRLADRISVIYNAKDRNQLLLRARQDEAAIGEVQPFILAVERLEESQKDITTLIRAYSILRLRHHRSERLVIIGKGRDEQRLRQLAADLGMAGDVVFKGFSSNPYPWMLHCRLLAHSARFEGLPTVLVEGLLLDCLIVATDCPTGPREILADGRAGLLTPVGDAEAMAEAMHRLLSDEQLRSGVHAAINEQRRRFTFEATAQQLSQLLS